MPGERLPDDFVRRLTDVQDRLYAYILALLPDQAAAREVLQESNVVMCRKFDALQEGQDFNAWACQVALFEVRSHRRNTGRDRHVFNDELLALVAEDAERHNAGDVDRSQALQYCLDKLEADQREMIRTRYSPGGSVQQIATETGRSASSISVTLYRIRQKLLDCMQRRMRQEANP